MYVVPASVNDIPFPYYLVVADHEDRNVSAHLDVCCPWIILLMMPPDID